MRKPIGRLAGILFLATSLCAQSSTPQPSGPDTAALEQHIKDLEDRIIALEGQVRSLKNSQAPPSPNATPEAGQVPAGGAAPPEAQSSQAGMVAQNPVSLGGAGGAAAKALNPDISVIGDFIGAVGGNSPPLLATVQPFPALQMHESEIGMQAIIDPYARGDFFFSFGEEGVNLEEGYITFTALPANFVAKVGKMRSAFGKVNGMHNHVLPWVDRPLVTTNLVGGEDGIDDAGVSVQRILPAPKGIFLEATGQVFRGDVPGVFRSWRASDVSTVDHLRAYKDITESTNLDLGFSYSRGYNDAGAEFVTNLYGMDATLRWKPLRRSIYHSFVARSELVWSRRQQFPFEQRAFGFYTAGEYQFARRWFLGGRFDRSDRSQFANLTDTGGSVILTYWPSEFSQIRGQYERTNYAEGVSANQLLMQVIFSLGAHGAHPF